MLEHPSSYDEIIRTFLDCLFRSHCPLLVIGRRPGGSDTGGYNEESFSTEFCNTVLALLHHLKSAGGMDIEHMNAHFRCNDGCFGNSIRYIMKFQIEKNFFAFFVYILNDLYARRKK